MNKNKSDSTIQLNLIFEYDCVLIPLSDQKFHHFVTVYKRDSSETWVKFPTFYNVKTNSHDCAINSAVWKLWSRLRKR